VTFADSRSLGNDTVSLCEWLAMLQRTVKGSSSWRRFLLRLLDPAQDDTASCLDIKNHVPPTQCHIPED